MSANDGEPPGTLSCPACGEATPRRAGAHSRFEDSLLGRMLESGQALLLLDGIDEIGSVEIRSALRGAVHEGMRRYRHCRWIITSRIVGYDEVPFEDVFGLSELPAESLATLLKVFRTRNEPACWRWRPATLTSRTPYQLRCVSKPADRKLRLAEFGPKPLWNGSSGLSSVRLWSPDSGPLLPRAFQQCAGGAIYSALVGSSREQPSPSRYQTRPISPTHFGRARSAQSRAVTGICSR